MPSKLMNSLRRREYLAQRLLSNRVDQLPHYVSGLGSEFISCSGVPQPHREFGAGYQSAPMSRRAGMSVDNLKCKIILALCVHNAIVKDRDVSD